MITPDEILHYWFGDSTNTAQINKEKAALWWGKNEKNDAECIERFSTTLERASRGELDVWLDEAKSAVALILCLDQFTRVIHRGTGRMFENDSQAQGITKRLVESEDDPTLPPAYRVFAYMPLMHAEDMALQDEGLRLFEKLIEAAEDEPSRNVLENNLSFMRAHRAIIERFGRFPHRNELLGRESTEEELEFLKGPNSSF